jgi:cytochrome c peroxidase
MRRLRLIRMGAVAGGALSFMLVALLSGWQRGPSAATTMPYVTAATTAAPSSFYASPFEKHPSAAILTQLGRLLFADPALSASGRMACASCHDPAHAYGPPNDRAVQLGGSSMSLQGVRAVPTLTYHQNTPPFTEHFSDTDGDDSIDQGPAGGRAWDGRASSAHEQAAIPLLSPFEMGNANSAAVIAKLKQSPSAARFRDAFGDHVLDDTALAWNGVLLALEVFQQSPEDFYPYSSKYDAFLRAKVDLAPAEQRGLVLFNDTNKGNCASCHPSAIKRGAFPQFTDNGFIALGVPRNDTIAANREANYYDLGLCGPLRTDLKDHPEYCGLFKTPTLRNVATRHVFFHNGAFHTLEDALKFYVDRDTLPGKVYPRGNDGRVRKFNDLPKAYWANVNTDAPFSGTPGKATLTAAESADIAAFLKTLTDGYTTPPGVAHVSTTARP